MTHPSRWAPPGWINTAPLEQAVQRIHDRVTAVSAEMVDRRGELNSLALYEKSRRRAVQQALRGLAKRRDDLQRELRRAERQLNDANTLNEMREL